VKHRGRLLDTLHRAETGPIVDEREFDRSIVTETIRDVIDEHDIRFPKDRLVNSDDELADRLFEAGLDLASQVGIYCQSTSRRMMWSRSELEEGIRYCPSEAKIGDLNDSATLRARTPEENSSPVISGGPYGVAVPEPLYVPMFLSYAQESVIDAIDPPTLEQAYGLPIKGASPWEALAGWREAELTFEVLKRAGRPGLSVGCVGLSTTDLAELSAASYGGFRPTDRHYVAMLAEFKTNYHMLTKVVHISRIGGLIQTFYNPIYGGFVGGEEGVALAYVAGAILVNQAYMGTTFGSRPEHPFLGCNTTRELVRAMSVAFQAVSRNTDLIIHATAGPASGPGTSTLLLENAAIAINGTVSGVSMIAGSMTASGVNPRHASGLDAKICGEVAHAVGGMSRDQANEIVTQLVAEYEPELEKKPIGKPFEEVYNVETIQPTPEWAGIYGEAKQYLSQLGLDL
jgi:methylamine--corrinoid protein Co-methyltransferase